MAHETAPNDAAFPETADDVPGLTKREWFAGLAMQGLFANPDKDLVASSEDKLANDAVVAADSLIAALNEEQTT